MDNNTPANGSCQRKCPPSGNASSGIYGLAFIGAAFYYLQQATTFQDGAIGFLKAIVWPAILVYKALTFLHG